jgi:alkyldihydroxyacetonephosphate synthase
LHAALIKGVREALKRTTGGAFMSCRFTHVYPDGPAPYYTFVGPAPAGGELAAWQEVKHTACEILAQHGATITHHHAVGRTHRPWYRKEVPELFTSALWEVKRHLDPAGIMNPGVLWEKGP